MSLVDDIDGVLSEAQTKRQFERYWFNLGKEIEAAEKAGRDSRVTALMDRVDSEIDNLSPAKKKVAAEFQVRGRFGGRFRG